MSQIYSFNIYHPFPLIVQSQSLSSATPAFLWYSHWCPKVMTYNGLLKLTHDSLVENKTGF
jgi:hypothetical protein